MPGNDSRHSRSARDALVPLLDGVVFLAWAGPLAHVILASKMVTFRGVRYPVALLAAVLLAAADSKTWHWRGGRAAGTALGIVASVGVAVYLMAPLYASPSGTQFATMIRDARRFREAVPTWTALVAMTAMFWYRGLDLRRDHKRVWAAFSWGIGAMGLVMLLGPAFAREDMPHLVLPVFVLLVSGLLATALAAQDRALTNPYGRSEAPTRGWRQWLLAMAITVLGIVAVGWLLGLLLSPEQMRRAIEATRPVALAIWQAINALIVGIVYAAFTVLARLFRLLGIGQGTVEAVEMELERGIQDQFGTMESTATGLPVWCQIAIQAALVIAAIAGTALLFWWRWRQRRASRKSSVAEERSSILSGQLVMDQLRGLWQKWTSRGGGERYLDLTDVEGTRRAVRAAYQQLIALAEARGQPRPAGVTPQAYEAALERALPGHRDEIERITAAYLVARYAAKPPTARQAEDTREALARIEGTARQGS